MPSALGTLRRQRSDHKTCHSFTPTIQHMRSSLLALAALPVALAAQTSFAPVGATWTYEQGTWGSPDTNLMVLEVVGDTLVQGRTFSMLQVNEGWFGCHAFVRLICESSDSMFYFDPSSGQYHLLFRWNAIIGGSWSTPVEQSGFLDTLDWTVIDTSHVMVDGLWLRRLNVDVVPRQSLVYSYGGTVVERLGGFSAPFTWILGFCDGETFNGLRCYSDPDITWLNPQFQQCDLGMGVSEQVRKPLMNVTPTIAPISGPISILIDEAKDWRLEVFDALGKAQAHTALINGHATFQPDRSGSYSIVASNGCEREVVRIVVY